MLNYNQKQNITFNDADILTARHHNAFCGLSGTVAPTTAEEQRKLDELKIKRTYDEIKATGTRTPFRDYIRQF